jgi:outer membrane protein TolC
MRSSVVMGAIGPIVVCGSLALAAAPPAAAPGVADPAAAAGSAAAPVAVPTLSEPSGAGDELPVGVTRRPAKLGFRQAVDRALARHPSAVVAEAEIARAEALVRQARASSLPTLTGSALYTRLDSDRTLGDRIMASANQLNANATLSVPLVVPQRWMSWSRASDNVDVARAGAAEVRRQLGVATGRAWLAVVSQRRIVEVSSRARDAAKAHADFAQMQLDGGVGNRIDAVRAAQEQSAAEAQLQAGRVGLARAREALGVLLGENAPVEAAAESTLPAAPPSVAAGLDESAANRTDVLLAQARLAAADASERAGWADFTPYLTGSFQTFLQDPASATNPVAGWQAQLALTIPFYDGGLRYGQADERAALLSVAQAQLEGARRQARTSERA